jgi:hypothetical protein
MSDFAKLQRNIVEQFEGDSDLLGIYCFILAKITWGDFVFNLKRKSHAAIPGQYMSTLEGLVKGLGKDKRRILRELNVLVEMGVFTLERRGKQCLVITTTNSIKKNALESASVFPKTRPEPKFRKPKSGKCHDSKVDEKWQMPQLESGKCHDSDFSNVANATFRDIPSFVSKEERNIEDKKKKISPSSKIELPKFSSEDIEIAKFWLTYAAHEMTWTKLPSSWTEENFAKEIAKIRKAIDLNQEGFLALLKFIEGDDFWVKNALSPAGMLKISKNTGLRKIDTILSQMKTSGMRQTEKLERLKDEPIEECPFIF